MCGAAVIISGGDRDDYLIWGRSRLITRRLTTPTRSLILALSSSLFLELYLGTPQTPIDREKNPPDEGIDFGATTIAKSFVSS